MIATGRVKTKIQKSQRKLNNHKLEIKWRVTILEIITSKPYTTEATQAKNIKDILITRKEYHEIKNEVTET
ncbi:MAG: hypothetical protein A2076_12560 [Geobacteraceae bacterium GWC2_53_11]|nr:MAG: hypothetical protein A2076_12560 [Geobacteraceae bacterium GWC2_53_11]